MNEYEITYIISGKAADEARDQLNAEVDKRIADMEGKINHASATLRRQLAYDIKKEKTGFVRVLSVALAPANIAAVHAFLKKNESVLRFSILNTPYREELPANVLASLEDAIVKPKTATDKPAKEVTMEDVEKGIEEALTEDVA
jgi:ribosomal protein S6